MSVNQDYRAAECYENANTICGSIIKPYGVQINYELQKAQVLTAGHLDIFIKCLHI